MQIKWPTSGPFWTAQESWSNLVTSGQKYESLRSHRTSIARGVMEPIMPRLLIGDLLGLRLGARQKLFQILRVATTPIRQFPVREESGRCPAPDSLFRARKELHHVRFGVRGKDLESAVGRELIEMRVALRQLCGGPTSLAR
jgi:hypothetical protein